MNKIIPFILVSFIIASSGTFALEPCPLAMKFVTTPADANQGLEVQVSWGSYSEIGITNEYGELVMDMGHLGIPDCSIQDFDVVITKCSDFSTCHKTISFNPNGFTTLDISGINLYEEVIDTTPYEKCDSCCLPPLCQSCENLGFIKPEDCPVQEQPDYTAEFLATAIVALIAGVGVGKYGLGVKVYTNTKGEVVKQHKHKNVVGYHSANIMHRYQPHKKGELIPNYSDEKDEKGKYKYAGG